MSEVQKSIDNKNFLFNLDFQSFLIFIFTFSIIVRLSYGFFINGDLYIWSFGSVSQGILRTTSRLIENNLNSKYSFLNNYYFSSLVFALGITLNTFLGLNLFRKILGNVYFSILYLISILFSPAGMQMFHNIHILHSWEQYFFSLFAPLYLLHSDDISNLKNSRRLIYNSIAILIIILGFFYREFTTVEIFSLILVLALTNKIKTEKFIFSSFTVLGLLVLFFSFYLPSDNVSRAVIDFKNISQIFLQQTDLYFISSFILGALIIGINFYKRTKSSFLYFILIPVILIILSIVKVSSLLVFIFLLFKISSSLLVKDFRKITYYSIINIVFSLYGLLTIQSANGHFLHLLIPLFILDAIQIQFFLRKYGNKIKNLLFLILTFNSFVIFSLGINGFVQTTKVLNKINHLSYELDIISEELVKENVDKKIFPLYGNPYYLNDIAIKNKSFYTKRCSKDFLSPDIQHKGVLLIHNPSFDCSIYNDNLGNYKKISSYSFDVKHFLPGYFFSNINTYKYSSYLPDEWVTTFPVDLNKNIVKYMLDIYVPKD